MKKMDLSNLMPMDAVADVLGNRAFLQLTIEEVVKENGGVPDKEFDGDIEKAVAHEVHEFLKEKQDMLFLLLYSLTMEKINEALEEAKKDRETPPSLLRRHPEALKAFMWIEERAEEFAGKTRPKE